METVKNKVKFGLKNFYIAPLTFDGTKYTYETPFKVPGAVNIGMDPSGDSNDFYADDTIYYSSNENQGYSGDLEIADTPDEMREKIYMESVDRNGAYTEISEVEIRQGAILFEIKGDKQNRRIVFYNCSFSRPKSSAKTKENSKTPATDTITIKMMPRETDYKVRTILKPSAANKTAYDSFFTKVFEEEPVTQTISK